MRPTKRLRGLILAMAALGGLIALDPQAGAALKHARPEPSATPPGNAVGPMRALPSPLYGVTVDNVANLTNLVADIAARGAKGTAGKIRGQDG